MNRYSEESFYARELSLESRQMVEIFPRIMKVSQKAS